jgi:16S rRNA (cytidine1402-2'-O)-methyltransferase
MMISEQSRRTEQAFADMGLESGAIYVVATPIGNLDDMTFRAVNVLRSVGIIAAEDTRQTRMLLSHFGIGDKRLVSLHEHNEAERIEGLLQAVAGGETLALVSDAGTPLVSDPGTLLVQAAWKAGVRLIPVVGASALTALLSVSPFGTAAVRFAGFLPAKSGPRREALLEMGSVTGAVVFFEAPHRIVETLRVIAEVFPDRKLLVGRELTKLHEEILLGTASEILKRVEVEHRGEFVCLLSGANVPNGGLGQHADFSRRQLIEVLSPELPPRALARLIGRLFDVPSREIYRELTGGSADEKIE